MNIVFIASRIHIKIIEMNNIIQGKTNPTGLYCSFSFLLGQFLFLYFLLDPILKSPLETQTILTFSLLYVPFIHHTCYDIMILELFPEYESLDGIIEGEQINKILQNKPFTENQKVLGRVDLNMVLIENQHSVYYCRSPWRGCSKTRLSQG